MTAIERLIHRGYFEEASDRGDEGSGGATDDTVKDQETKVEDKAAENKEEDEKVKASLTVPKARFDQAVAKARREAEEASKRAEAAEAQLKAQQGEVNTEELEKQLDKISEELDKAIADNDPAKKAELRRSERALIQQAAEARAAAHARYATAVAIEQVRYDAAVKSMETEHPELNPDNEAEFDENAVAELKELKEAYEAKGESSTVALTKALKVMYKYGAKSEEAKPAKGEDKAEKRKEEAVKRGLEASKRTPADQKKAGLDSDKAGKSGNVVKDILKMTNKEFDKLDAATLAAARGDEYSEAA